MRSASAKFFLSLLFLVMAYGGAEAASAREDAEYLPQVSSFEFRQIGANDLMVDIHGRAMPLPQVSSDGNITEIVLPAISGDKVPQYDNQGMAPLVTGVRSRQLGEDFVITIMTARPLQANAIRGVPPSDVYNLSLKTAEELQKIVEERVATDHPQTLRVPTGPFASNEPVTLDLRDTELRDVFRMFGEQVKKNIVIHDSMPPVLVTMTFKKSPISSVFGYLMKSYDLSYEFIDKDTIIIGTAEGLARISGKLETRVYRIAYADPAALSGLLPSLTKIQASGLVVDPRLRTIYATGAPDVLEEVAIAIQKLDNPGKQVMLHARILQFNKGDELEVERALNVIYDHWAFTYTREGLTGMVADAIDVPASFGDDPTLGTTTDGRLVPSGLGDRVENTWIPLYGDWREFDATFRLLETNTSAKTLANPSVITLDGVEASISLTEDYPYISGRDDAGNATWSTISVGPQLRMTPKVGRDDTVTLTLDLQASETSGTIEGSLGEQMPMTSRRQVLTNVRVRNGEPFVVGGLFTDRSQNDTLRIPILGQLPLLGELFTIRTNNRSTTQVVMVVIPYILDTPDTGVVHERVMIRQ